MCYLPFSSLWSADLARICFMRQVGRCERSKQALTPMTLRNILALVLFLLLPIAATAQSFDHSHKAWDALLKKHVVLISGGKSSQLDYAGMIKDREALKAYLATLSKVSEAE